MEFLMLALFSAFLFWEVTLVAAVLGFFSGLSVVLSIQPSVWRTLVWVIGSILAIVAPAIIAEAYFPPDAGLGILGVAFAGAIGAFIGYTLPFVISLLSRFEIREKTDEVSKK